MIDFMTAPLSELKTKLIQDGKIDRAEVDQMRKRLLEDHTVDRYEAEFMFAVSDAVKEERNTSKFEELFIDVITAHVLDGGLTPDNLDPEEWFWLENKLMSDHDVGELELRLLKNIHDTAQETPDDFKSYIRDLLETEDVHDTDEVSSGGFFRKLFGG